METINNLGTRYLELSKCKTKKELILTYYKTRKSCKNVHETKKLEAIFNEFYDSLDTSKKYYEKLLIEKEIFKLLSTRYIDKNQILKKCDDLNISYFNLIKFFEKESLSFERPMNNRLQLSQVSHTLRELAITTYMTEENARDFEIAKVIIKMHVESGNSQDQTFCDSINMHQKAYANYRNILKTANHPIYKELEELKAKAHDSFRSFRTERHAITKQQKEEEAILIIKTSSKEQLKELIKSANSYYYSVFCKVYNLSPAICYYMWNADKNFFTNLIENMDNIKEVYEQKVEMYKEQTKRLAEAIRTNPELNLFDCYEQFGISVKNFVGLSNSLGQTEEFKIITEYVSKNKDKFYCLTTKELDMILKNEAISNEKGSIRFDVKEFHDAVKEITEKKYPMHIGVIYGAIKKQHENNQIKQEKEKTHIK